MHIAAQLCRIVLRGASTFGAVTVEAVITKRVSVRVRALVLRRRLPHAPLVPTVVPLGRRPGVPKSLGEIGRDRAVPRISRG